MKNTIKFSIVFVGLVFCINHYFFYYESSLVGTFCSYCLYPALRIQKCVIEPIRHLLDYRFDIIDMEHKYNLLQNDRDVLFAENIALKASLYYMKDIGALLQFKKRYERTGEFVVHVLARHLSHENQFFLVNAGSRDGIKKDMVALYGNCLIGKVVQVYPWYCKVSLITDAECKVAVSCVKTGTIGIHEGTNDIDKSKLCHISHLENVAVGDMVISSGEGLVFPQGFALGLIVSAQKGDLVYTIEVKPLIDLNHINYCTLLSKSDIESRGSV